MSRERVYKTENNRLLEAIYNEKLLENTRTIKNLEDKISELQELLKDSLSRRENETSNMEEESKVELEPASTQDLEEACRVIPPLTTHSLNLVLPPTPSRGQDKHPGQEAFMGLPRMQRRVQNSHKPYRPLPLQA